MVSEYKKTKEQSCLRSVWWPSELTSNVHVLTSRLTSTDNKNMRFFFQVNSV